MTSVAISHIAIDDEGRAWLSGTNTKVIEIVLEHLAYGWSADEICRQHPHLSLSKVYAALSYYYDNQLAFEAEMDRQLDQ